VGLMLGVEFATHQAANAVELAAFGRGLLLLACGEASLRLCAPVIVDEPAVDTAIRLVGEAIEAAATPVKGINETGG
jgi:4-aminobutyrate aminotransferase